MRRLGRVVTLLTALAGLAAPAAGQAGANLAAERLRVPVSPAGPAAAGPGAVQARGALSVLAPANAPALGSALTDGAASAAPELRLWREVSVGVVGLGLLLAGELMGVDRRPVPAGGLDPSEISWALDRRSLETVDPGRLSASDWTLKGALALPVVAELAFAPGGGEPWSRAVRSGVVYAEAVALAAGVTWLGKSLFSRPRPYTYVPTPADPERAYDPTRERAFRSMPSGHASLAWTGAATALTAYLLDRPHARWTERAGVGAVAAGLATTTALLRVRAGQHFPTDVLVGSGIGMAAGVAVTLLHRDGRPLPTGQALLETASGMVASSVLMLLLF